MDVYLISGDSKAGRYRRPPSPTGPIPYIFMQFSLNIWLNTRFMPLPLGLTSLSEKFWIHHSYSWSRHNRKDSNHFVSCENPCDGKQNFNILICSVGQGQHVIERYVPELIKQRTESTCLYTAEFKFILLFSLVSQIKGLF